MRWGVGAAALALLLSGCSGGSEEASPSSAAESTPGDDATVIISVETPAFGAGEAIPLGFSLEGGNTSPEIRWTVTGERVAELVLVVDDPDAPGGEPFVHWMAARIDPRTTSVSAGGRPDGAVEGENDFGRIGYGGPAPPEGETHTYRFRVLALDARSDLEEGFTPDELEAVLDAHLVASGETTGTFTG